ncbi:MAG TPA: 2Fe-2S iron-sulfur cluster-binding protein [Candidatus Binataceae bacterium]|nr:2Fe-2S iron-sulfur cluster-binding protein [Candidatus Binataceae bacterium]
MPKVTIDGKELDAPNGINLIQAAEMLGSEIPHYCYHPALTIVGNCRMCLVEVEKAPKLQIACNTMVAEGMVVHTKSDKAKAAQRAVLEFLLINHPIDCPVCDQAGECKLQDYYMDYDREPSRFELGKKVKKGKAIDIGCDVMLDQERCVLCARCTRFLDDVTHTSELAIFERGDHNRIDIYPGRKLDNKYAGNIIDICPVGALTEKDFRFRMRVWYLHRTPSVCAGCERGCAIDIYENHGKIFRYKPRHNPQVNGYWMCDEGRHSFKDLQTERRITRALHQSGEHLVPESFSAGIRRAADAIRKSGESDGARAIGALVGAQATNEEIFALKSFMNDVIGSDVIGGMSYTPPGLSGDDALLIRANKNPNTRGLQAQGIPLDGLDRLGQAAASGQLKTLIVLRADAARALGEEEFIKRFGALDYMLVFDTDANNTVQMANQVIPIASYPELEGSFTNFQGVVQRLNRAFDPPGEAKPAIEAITDLSMVLDGVERPQSAERIFAEIAAREPAFAGLAFDSLGHNGMKLANA